MMNQRQCIDWSGFITLITSTKNSECEDKKPSKSTLNDIHTNHTIHSEKFLMVDKRDACELSTIMGWITIMLEKGHIEPAQPQVGKYIGWPIRKHLRNSLYIDFVLWCRKSLSMDAPLAPRFFRLVDQLLVQTDQFYVFPPLEECRERFKKLLKIVEEEPWIF